MFSILARRRKNDQGPVTVVGTAHQLTVSCVVMGSDLESGQSSNGDGAGLVSRTSKKRKRYGRMKDVMKKIKLNSHTTGDERKCQRLKCFENVPLNGKRRIIMEFNYLGGLITALPVQRCKNRKSHDASTSFAYRDITRFMTHLSV